LFPLFLLAGCLIIRSQIPSAPILARSSHITRS
jgi:hypothetical protein